MHPNKKKSKNLASSGYHPSHSIPPHPVLPSVAPHITNWSLLYRGGTATASFHDKQQQKKSQLQSEQSTPIFLSLEPYEEKRKPAYCISKNILP